ncbi:MAG: T9SS type A sorting domain-containing protein [Bacteroidia bacterium]|nr:T9SS type A sorting domain-containing protein [Bacteroidia bacterium]
MKKVVLIVLSVFSLMTSVFAQVQTFMKVYGDLPADTTRAYKILPLPDTTFLIGGQWDNKAYIMKVDYDGSILNYFDISDTISGLSKVLDMLQLPNGEVVAVGECENCTPDSTDHVFAVRVDTALNLFNLRFFYGTSPTNSFTYGPSVAYGNGVLAVSMSKAGAGLNFEDVWVHSLDNNLNTLWDQTYHSCGNCGFDYAYDLTPTNTGFAMIVGNAFLDSVRMYHLSPTGAILWKKAHYNWDGISIGKLVASNGTIYLAGGVKGLPIDSLHFTAVISAFYESDGATKGFAIVNDSLINERFYDIQLSSGGTLLAGYTRNEPNLFGTYLVSRLYRIDTANFSVLGYVQIPNPNTITNMGVQSVVPFNADATEFASCGIRGFINRGFYYAHLPCKMKSTSLNATICQGETYNLAGVTYNSSGTYTATLVAANSCDSIVTLNLTVLPNSSSSINATICQGETYNLAGVTYNSSGTYTATLVAANGCDSVVTLNLAVLPNLSSSINATICQGETYNFGGVTYNSSGTYVATLTAANGCDSVVTLNLAVLPNLSSTVNAAICQGATYNFGGVTYSTSGTYSATFTAAGGCDSVVTLNLSVLPNLSSTTSANICQGETYSLGGVMYSTAGTYVATLTAASGCDSVVTLHLNVTGLDTTVTINSYNLNVPLQTGVAYQWISCADNQPVPGAISNSFSPTQSGAYKVAVTSGNCTDTSACHNVLATGIDHEFAESLRIYPQPAHDQFWLEMSTPYPAVELQLTDMQGRTVWQKNLQNEVVTIIPVSFLATGVYLLHVQTEGKYAVRKVLKQ